MNTKKVDLRNIKTTPPPPPDKNNNLHTFLPRFEGFISNPGLEVKTRKMKCIFYIYGKSVQELRLGKARKEGYVYIPIS